MKTLNITFEDKDYEQLKTVKADMTWNEFILTLLNIEEKEITQ